MTELLVIIAVSATAFVGTNMDNLVLLVAMHANYREHPGAVSAGYIAGMLLIGAVFLSVSLLGELIPVAYLGLLGFIPITAGVLGLVGLLRNKNAADTVQSPASDMGPRAVFTTLVTTQLANSTDTIVAFSTLTAESSDFSDHLVFPVFVVLVLGFAWLARFLLSHGRLAGILERYGHYATPFILILVGIYILSNTMTDLAPG